MEKYYECFREEYFGCFSEKYAEKRILTLQKLNPNKDLQLIESEFLIIKQIGRKLFKIIDLPQNYVFIVDVSKVKSNNILLCAINPLVFNVDNLPNNIDKLSKLNFPDYYIGKTVKKFTSNILDEMIPRIKGQVIITNSNTQIFNIDDEKNNL
jgi:hypothetical protein